ncbi:MAG: glycosyltransferase family 4 protein [bacterium]
MFRDKRINVTIFCQDHVPGMNLTSIHEKYGNRIEIIKYVSLDREKIVWQFLPWMQIFRQFDVVYVDGNPRNVSHLLLATVFRLARKGLVLWTMAHSYRANHLTESVRLLWARIFNDILVYTDHEVDFLRNRGFKRQNIIGVNNGLDQKRIDQAAEKWPPARLQKWRESVSLVDRVLILSCARLVPKNRFDQLILALPKMVAKVPNLVWCLIGDGGEESNLRALVASNRLEPHVRFVGGLYEEDEVAPWFLSSELFIHPAAVGLSLLHAFGYGLPVITHGDATVHGPEYGAYQSGSTGVNYRIGDIDSLADRTLELLSDDVARARMRTQVLDIARNCYNTDVMVERFMTMTFKVLSKQSNASQ